MILDISSDATIFHTLTDSFQLTVGYHQDYRRIGVSSFV